ncbi:MAG: GNAT family N-acetyltransferase [Clostridia bacterium]|nr:GNAT family N-acetyltransferase [Clostridia bacterium]
MIFKKCELNQIEGLMTGYVKSLSSPVESYLEEHIKSSDHYVIIVGEKEIGYFSIYKKEMLTQFYITKQYRHLAQEIFQSVKKTETVLFSYVPTCDEFFLSHALDCHSRVERQAYFFSDSKRTISRDKILDKFSLRTATDKDIKEIIETSGEFFDKIEERVARDEIFIALLKGKTAGFGIIEKGTIMKGFVSIGMFVIPSYREQGVGRNILLGLKKFAYENELKPVAGCWYYNHNSKKSLESAGMYASCRLLKIYF